MPSKNSVKKYVVNGVYHIYNRGVEKREIFLDEQDYSIFLYYLKSYLTPLKEQIKPPSSIRYLRDFTLPQEIQLIAYVLMPTHFHLMLKQFTEKAIVEFMKRLCNAYVSYFNKKYERVGTLFQSRYKAVLIDKENYYLHLTRYIHLNPIELFSKDIYKKLQNYSYSSYPDYIGKRNTQWIHKQEIIEYFKHNQDELGFSTYQEFTEKYAEESREILKNITID